MPFETAVVRAAPAGHQTPMLAIAVARGGLPASVAAKRIRTLGVARGAFHLPVEARGGVTPADAGQAIAEGLAQGAWQFLEMKRPADEKKAPLERVEVLAPDDHDAF